MSGSESITDEDKQQLSHQDIDRRKRCIRQWKVQCYTEHLANAYAAQFYSERNFKRSFLPCMIIQGLITVFNPLKFDEFGYPEEAKSLTVSFLTATCMVLSGAASYFGWLRLMEAHRVASKAWSQLVEKVNEFEEGLILSGFSDEKWGTGYAGIRKDILNIKKEGTFPPGWMSDILEQELQKDMLIPNDVKTEIAKSIHNNKTAGFAIQRVREKKFEPREETIVRCGLAEVLQPTVSTPRLTPRDSVEDLSPSTVNKHSSQPISCAERNSPSLHLDDVFMQANEIPEAAVQRKQSSQKKKRRSKLSRNESSTIESFPGPKLSEPNLPTPSTNAESLPGSNLPVPKLPKPSRASTQSLEQFQLQLDKLPAAESKAGFTVSKSNGT